MLSAAWVAAWFIAHGCSPACAAGITANLEAESALDPCIVSTSGIGLAQWAGERRRRLQRLLGRGWCGAEAQLGHILTELDEFGIRERLFRSTDPSAAARLFMLEFEKPRNRDPRNRAARARALYGVLRGR